MAEITAIQDRLTIDLDEVKEFLRIDESNTSFDVTLTTLIEASKQAADAYCQNEFLDDDGTELDIPAKVKFWCLTWIARHTERGPNGITIIQIRELGSAEWGIEDYRDLHSYRMTWF